MGLIDTERCGIIVYNGGPGDINHRKGVHRNETRCPVSLWQGIEDAQQRLEICRACKYYLKPGVKMPDTF